MVSDDTRNNLIVLIILVSVAILVAAIVAVFTVTVLNVAEKAEQAVHRVGGDLVGNISNLKTNLGDAIHELNTTITGYKNIHIQTLHELINQTKITNELLNHTNATIH